MNGPLYFEIHADDPDRAAAFYQSVFGWTFQKVPNNEVEYWRIETGETAGGLLKRPAETPPPECGMNAFVSSVEVDDFDATAQAIERHGGQVALPKFAVPGVCWHGYFVDPEGNTFGIFQPDETAA